MSDRGTEAALRALQRMNASEAAGPATQPDPSPYLSGPDPNDPSYRDNTKPNAAYQADSKISEWGHKLRDKLGGVDWKDVAKKGLQYMTSPTSGIQDMDRALVNQFANRDNPQASMPPQSPEELQGGDGVGARQDSETPQGDPIATPNGAPGGTPEGDGSFVPGQMPRLQPGGGGGGGMGGMGSDARARMMAGDVGVTPQLQGAVDQSKRTLDAGFDQMDARQLQMEQALADQQQARRDIAAQEEQKARAMQKFLDTRMAEEEVMRADLRKSATINPSGYWDEYENDFGKSIYMAVAMGFGAGGKATDAMRASIQRDVERHVEAQVKTYENKLAMSKEQRAQWDQRMAVLGDIEQAKISAKIQGLESARDNFAGRMNLAKTDEAKMRLAQMADGLDMKIAEMQQEMASKVQQAKYKELHEREAAARAAAARAQAQAREDFRYREDQRFKEHMLDKSLGSKEEIARMRGARGAGGPGGSGITANAFMKQLERYGKDVEATDKFEDSYRNVEKLMEKHGNDLPGQGPLAGKLPDWALGQDGKELRQTFGNLKMSEVYRRTGKAATDAERASIDKVIAGAGTKQDLQNGINVLRRIVEIERNATDRRNLPEIKDYYQNGPKSGGR